MSNYHLGSFAFEKKNSHDELTKVQDDIYQKLILTNVPDLHGQYYANGKDAFLANNEIVNRKIQDLLLINFDTNYASDIKSIAFLSRNLVNDFHWSFFKRVNVVQQDRNFINSVFISGNETQSSIIGKMLNIEDETGKLVKKMILDIGEKNL